MLFSYRSERPSFLCVCFVSICLTYLSCMKLCNRVKFLWFARVKSPQRVYLNIVCNSPQLASCKTKKLTFVPLYWFSALLQQKKCSSRWYKSSRNKNKIPFPVSFFAFLTVQWKRKFVKSFEHNETNVGKRE